MLLSSKVNPCRLAPLTGAWRKSSIFLP